MSETNIAPQTQQNAWEAELVEIRAEVEREMENLVTELWLRWTDREGRLIPTSAEWARGEQQRATEAEQYAEQERQRTERLAARLRELGVEPSE